jgi:predicted permease
LISEGGWILILQVVFPVFSVIALDYAVAMLLMAAPTAIVSYVKAVELAGDRDLASSIVMLSTLFSVFSYSFLLLLLG